MTSPTSAAVPIEIQVWRVQLGPDDGRREAREALGHILAGALGEAEAPALALGESGKPHLAEDPDRLSFNLSHAGRLALIAIAPGGVEVGVDIEKLKERRDLPRLAARWLPRADASAVATAPPGKRERLFYAAWTRHEARVKCTGAGLAGPAPGPEVTAWPISIDLGYAAAVAIATTAEPQIVVRDAASRR
jgi:4'-phosphopantetheinyl transferase